MRTVNVSGSTSMRGNASLSGMSALPTLRTSLTATSRRLTANRFASPSSIACGDTKCTDVAAAAAGDAPNIGRGSTGCGVGIDAFASPIAAHAIMPPLITACGRTPKKAGSHSTPALLHHVCGLPGAQHHLAGPAHRLRVAADHRDRADVVQQVLCGDRR